MSSSLKTEGFRSGWEWKWGLSEQSSAEVQHEHKDNTAGVSQTSPSTGETHTLEPNLFQNDRFSPKGFKPGLKSFSDAAQRRIKGTQSKRSSTHKSRAEVWTPRGHHERETRRRVCVSKGTAVFLLKMSPGCGELWDTLDIAPRPSGRCGHHFGGSANTLENN